MDGAPPILDLKEFATALPARLSKDERRVRLFLADLPTVALRLATTQPDRVNAFLQGAGDVAQAYVKGLNPSKWSLASLLGRDPLHDARETARRFARTWNMSAVLIDELG